MIPRREVENIDAPSSDVENKSEYNKTSFREMKKSNVVKLKVSRVRHSERIKNNGQNVREN